MCASAHERIGRANRRIGPPARWHDGCFSLVKSNGAGNHGDRALEKGAGMHPDFEELIWITIKAFGAMLALVYIIRIGRLGFVALNAL